MPKPKQKHPSSKPPPPTVRSSKPTHTINNLTTSLSLLLLAALTSPISQTSLWPIYGSLPSSVHHSEFTSITFLTGFLLPILYPDHLTFSRNLAVVQSTAASAPHFWTLSTAFSGTLGPIVGPAVTGLLTGHAVLGPSVAACVAVWSPRVDLRSVKGVGGVMVFAVVSLTVFTVVERWFGILVPMLLTAAGRVTPATLQVLVALAYAVLGASWRRFAMVGVSVVALLGGRSGFLPTFSSSSSPSSLLPFGNHATLTSQTGAVNWTVLDWRWSTTGYISVVEDRSRDVRFLRCDHSILGGEWLLTDARRTGEGWSTTEPIYAVFEMLEAVRLIDNAEQKPDDQARALVIGLGIGTAPKALLSHGINTTVVELDPAVHDFATTYFDLPSNRSIAVLGDAVSWVSNQVRHDANAPLPSQASSNPRRKYEYIIHDVFTGGAEPFALFTYSFLHALRRLLQPHGVAAINYAGSLENELTRKVLRTVDFVFDGQCRMFSDEPPIMNDAEKEGEAGFSNMVIFCRNRAGPINFRKPINADFLGSISRQHYLVPRADAEVPFPWGKDRGLGEQDLLHEDEASRWRSQLEASAIQHWHIMRTVLPDDVWERPYG